MIVVHAAVPVVPDRREQALSLARELAAKTRREDGVLDYRATTEVGDPDVIHFFERYEDEAALDAHQQSDHYREWTEALPDLLDGGVADLDVTQFVVDEAFDPNANLEDDAGDGPASRDG